MNKQTKPYDFQISTHPITTDKGHQILGRKAIVRNDTEQVLGVVSDKYQVIRHQAVIEEMEQELNLDPKTASYNISHDGAIAFARYDFKQIPRFEAKLGDVVNFKIELFNSYNGYLQAGFRLIGERLACTNGMVIAGSMSSIKIRHTSNASVAVGKEEFSSKLKIVEKAKDSWSTWLKTELTDSRVETFNKRFLSKKTADEITGLLQTRYLKECGPNVWAYFNALTDYSTHRLKTRKGHEKNIAMKRYYFEKDVIEPFYTFNWN